MSPARAALRVDAAVVGGGPAGSSMAAALADAGWRVLLVERDRLPRHKVCGEFLSPEAQTTLRHLGMIRAVAGLHPAVLEQARLTAADGHSLTRPLPGPAWGISRYALDAALVDAAAGRGAELCLGTTATRLVQRGAELELYLQQRGVARRVKARSVVMACGRHSLPGLTPRRAAPRRSRRTAVGVKCHYVGLELRPQVELFLFPGGYAGINPVEGGRANLCLLSSYDAFAAAGRSVPALIAAAAAANPALAQRLAGARPLDETVCAVAPVDTAAAANPWQGVPRLGDAAVMLPPLCGDGMAMALRSAELCAPLADGYLRHALSREEWARAYRRAWQTEFAARVRLGRALQRLLLTPALAGKLLAAGAHLPGLADYLIRATRGPVSWDAGHMSGSG